VDLPIDLRSRAGHAKIVRMFTTHLLAGPLTSGLDRSWLRGTLARLIAFLLAEAVLLLAARTSALPDAAVGAGLLLVVLPSAAAALWAAVDVHGQGRAGPVIARWAVVAVAAGGLLAAWDAGTGLRGQAGVVAAVVLLASAIGCSAGLLTVGRRRSG